MLSQIVIASAFAGLAAAAPLTNNFARAAESIITYGPYNATHFRSTHFEGSCGWTNRTNQFIASVAVNASATDGALCGRTINVTSLWNGESVLAQIVDERKDVPAGYLNLSRVAFEELAPISYGHIEATYTLTGEHSTQRSSHSAHVEEPKTEEPKTEEPKHEEPKSEEPKHEEPKAEETSTSSSHRAPAHTPSSSSSSHEAEYTPKSSSSSSSRRQPEHTPEAEYTPKTTSSSSSRWVAPTTSEKKEEYTPAYTPSTTSSRKQEAAPTPQRQSGGNSGRATWFTQNSNAGHCGNVNSDSAYIVALSSSIFNMGRCGQGVQITNTANGRSVYATVADSCPGCGSGSLDLSLGAFQAIGNLDSGVLPISWNWA